MLGRGIGDHSAIVLNTGIGRGDDNAAAALPAHGDNGGLCGHEVRPNVDGPGRVHVVHRHLLQLAFNLDAGVRVQNIKLSMALCRPSDGGAQGRIVGYVELKRLGLPALFAKTPHDRFRARQVLVRQHDLRSLARQGFCSRRSDPGGCACDECDTSL